MTPKLSKALRRLPALLLALHWLLLAPAGHAAPADAPTVAAPALPAVISGAVAEVSDTLRDLAIGSARFLREFADARDPIADPGPEDLLRLQLAMQRFADFTAFDGMRYSMQHLGQVMQEILRKFP